MRKVVLHTVILSSCLILAQLLALRPVHAAPGKVVSGPTLTTAAAAMAGKSATRSSALYPVTITKVRFLTKTFGNVLDGNTPDLLFFLQPVLPFSGTARVGLYPPVPAGRSP